MSIRSINFSYLFVFLLIFPFIKPIGFDVFGFFLTNYLINILECLCIIFLFFKLKFRFGSLFWAELIYFALLFFTFFYNNSDYSIVLKMAINALGIQLLLRYLFQFNRMIFNCFSFWFIILLSFNLIWIYNNHGWQFGWYDTWKDPVRPFIESKNGVNSYVMSALFFEYFNMRIKKQCVSVFFIIISFLCIFTEIRLWSASSVIGLFLFFLYFFIRKSNYINGKIVLLLACILNIAVSFFHVQLLFSYLFQVILNRNATMTGRTDLWDIGLHDFWESPFIGVGKIGIHLDNLMIQNIVFGGFFVAFALVFVLFVVSRNIIKNKNAYLQKDSLCFFSIIIILSITEAWCNFRLFWLILSLLSNIHLLRRKFNEK